MATAEAGSCQKTRPFYRSVLQIGSHSQIGTPHIAANSMWGVPILLTSYFFVQKDAEFDRSIGASHFLAHSFEIVGSSSLAPPSGEREIDKAAKK
jgi:hypothetical protein